MATEGPAMDEFFAVLDAYKVAFRDVPATSHLPPEAYDRLAPAMWEAIRRGAPLTQEEQERATGAKWPPAGACW